MLVPNSVHSTQVSFGSDWKERKPEAAEIMMKYGLHCIGCHISAYETVEEGARAHGISEDNIDNLLSELNKI